MSSLNISRKGEGKAQRQNERKVGWILNEKDVLDYMSKEGIQGRLVPLSVLTETVEAAAAALGISTERIVKSLLFLVDGRPVLVISCGRDRIDRRPLAEQFGVGRKRIKLADAEAVKALTGYEVGAVPPFAHREKLQVIVDRSILDHNIVYAGGGTRDCLLEISPEEIIGSTGAMILDVRAVDEEAN